MNAGISIEITGYEEIRAALRALVRNSQDLTVPFDRIGAKLRGSIEFRFDTKTDPSGEKWKPLAGSTKARYAIEDGKVGKGGRRGSLLERTGFMRASLTHRASSTELVVGFGMAYAQYHEFGTRRMPRRGILLVDPKLGRFSDEDTAAILKILADWTAQVLKPR